MKAITFLHLSDLHYSPSTWTDAKIIFEALLKDLRRLSSEEGIRPEIVVFSGDLVCHGDTAADFDEVKDVFIMPLLGMLNIDNNLFFIAPGNHDVQKSKIDKIIETGFSLHIRDTETLNRFLDDPAKQPHYFSRLENFNKFKSQIESNHKVSSNILYSTYRVEIKGVDLGIACLNSSWRASGEGQNFDYGKLLVGERQIDKAAEDLRDCSEVMSRGVQIEVRRQPPRRVPGLALR